jgi:hypothetical protein
MIEAPSILRRPAKITKNEQTVLSGIDGVHQSLAGIAQEVSGQKEALSAIVGKVDEVLLKLEPPEVGPEEDYKEDEPEDRDIKTDMDSVGVSLPIAPTLIDTRAGEYELTPEQRETYAKVSCDVVYKVMQGIVNSPQWEMVPAVLKRRMYERAFASACKVGTLAAVPPMLRRHV